MFVFLLNTFETHEMYSNCLKKFTLISHFTLHFPVEKFSKKYIYTFQKTHQNFIPKSKMCI